MEENKICRSCDRNLEISNFYKSKSNKDGYHSYCKECLKEKSKKWMENNNERYREKMHERAVRRWQRPENKEYQRSWAKKQRENGYQKEWQNKNKDKLAEYREIRELHKKHEILEEQWIICKEYFNNCCAYCGLNIKDHLVKYGGKYELRDFHKEHVDHDGKNDISNCVPSCKSCNSKKWKYEFNDWYNESNMIFDIDRLERIVKWLNGDYLKAK